MISWTTSRSIYRRASAGNLQSPIAFCPR